MMMGFLCYKGEDKMNHYFTNEDLKSNLKQTTVKIKDRSFCFYTDNGVFSKRGLDFGSRVLIETLLQENLHGSILDVGCGYGAIGIILSSFFYINVEMIDVNRRAIHLTEMNIKKNNVSNISVYESDTYDKIIKKFDFIITNPPIRAGKKVVYDILFGAKDYLVNGGSLYFVMNKDQGAKSAIKDLSKIYRVEVIKKFKGFFVIKCIFD